MATAAASVLQEFLCSICLEYLKEPHSLKPCNHVYCRACLLQLINSNISHCPTCRTESTGHCPDEFMAHKMRTTEIHCTVCNSMMKASEMNQHNARCSDRPENFTHIEEGGNESSSQSSTMYRCPFCRNEFKGSELTQHCSQFHQNEEDQKLVCPICASMPWGKPDLKSSHLVSHLELRHRFDYESYAEMWESNEDDALAQAVIQSLSTQQETEEDDLSRALAESLSTQTLNFQEASRDTHSLVPEIPDIGDFSSTSTDVTPNQTEIFGHDPHEFDDVSRAVEDCEYYPPINESHIVQTQNIQDVISGSHTAEEDDLSQAIAESLNAIAPVVPHFVNLLRNPQQAIIQSLSNMAQSALNSPQEIPEFHQAIIESINEQANESLDEQECVIQFVTSSFNSPQEISDSGDLNRVNQGDQLRQEIPEDSELNQAIIESLTEQTSGTQVATSSQNDDQELSEDEDLNRAIFESLQASSALVGTSSHSNTGETPECDRITHAAVESLTFASETSLDIGDEDEAFHQAVRESLMVQPPLDRHSNSNGTKVKIVEECQGISEAVASQTGTLDSGAVGGSFDIQTQMRESDNVPTQTLGGPKEIQAQTSVESAEIQTQTLVELTEIQTQTLVESAEIQTQTLVKTAEIQTQTLVESAEIQTQTLVESADIQTQTLVKTAEIQTQTSMELAEIEIHQTLKESVDAETQTDLASFGSQTQPVLKSVNVQTKILNDESTTCCNIDTQTQNNKRLSWVLQPTNDYDESPETKMEHQGMQLAMDPQDSTFSVCDHALNVELPTGLNDDSGFNKGSCNSQQVSNEGESSFCEMSVDFNKFQILGEASSETTPSDVEFVSCEYFNDLSVPAETQGGGSVESATYVLSSLGTEGNNYELVNDKRVIPSGHMESEALHCNGMVSEVTDSKSQVDDVVAAPIGMESSVSVS